MCGYNLGHNFNGRRFIVEKMKWILREGIVRRSMRRDQQWEVRLSVDSSMLSLIHFALWHLKNTLLPVHEICLLAKLDMEHGSITISNNCS